MIKLKKIIINAADDNSLKFLASFESLKKSKKKKFGSRQF